MRIAAPLLRFGAVSTAQVGRQWAASGVLLVLALLAAIWLMPFLIILTTARGQGDLISRGVFPSRTSSASPTFRPPGRQGISRHISRTASC